VFDVDPVIEELPIQRPWGAVGKVRLAAGARLFGPSRWRFRLDRSRLSQAPIRSYGNPDRDPFNALVWRFRVLVPLALNDQTRQRMQLLIEAQKPAHTVASLHDRSGAFVLGPSISLGIDTAFRPFEPSVLSGNGPGIRLGRGSILSSAPAGAAGGVKWGKIPPWAAHQPWDDGAPGIVAKRRFSQDHGPKDGELIKITGAKP